jgi:hypothetical protein
MHWNHISLVQKLIHEKKTQYQVSAEKLMNRDRHNALCQYLILAKRNMLKLDFKGSERFFCLPEIGKILFCDMI